jgi:carbonic anhydrase
LDGWYFQGSLTTPPLSRPVYWFVLKTPITLDAGQLAEYQTVATDGGFLPNARPIQPQDGRRLNEIDNDVSFQNGPVANVNFMIAPRA